MARLDAAAAHLRRAARAGLAAGASWSGRPGSSCRRCRPTSRWSTTRARGSARCRAWRSAWRPWPTGPTSAFVCSTDLPFLHAELVRRVLRPFAVPDGDGARRGAARWPAATRSRWPRPTAPGWPPVVAALVAADRLRPAFIFEDAERAPPRRRRAAGRPGAAGGRPDPRVGGQRQRARRLRAGPGPAGPGGDRRVLRRAGHPQRPRAAQPSGPPPSGPRPAPSTWSSTGTCSQPSTATRPAGTPSCPCWPATPSPSSPRTPADDALPGGYFGRALVVDVTDGTSRVVELPTGCCATTSAVPGSAYGCSPTSPRPVSTRSAPEAPLAFVFSPAGRARRSRPARSSRWSPSRR